MRNLMSIAGPMTALITTGMTAAHLPVAAEPVTVDYTARVTTMTGTPFGAVPGGATVTGFFTYESATPDQNPDPDRGDYPHPAGGVFRAEIEGFSITVTGSTTPYVQIEHLSSHTFRFIDGPRLVGPAGGTMEVNGNADSSVELSLAITDPTASVFIDDRLPVPFPFSFPPGVPHTLSLGDAGGLLLLTIDTTSPTPVEPTTWARVKETYR